MLKPREKSRRGEPVLLPSDRRRRPSPARSLLGMSAHPGRAVAPGKGRALQLSHAVVVANGPRSPWHLTGEPIPGEPLMGGTPGAEAAGPPGAPPRGARLLTAPGPRTQWERLVVVSSRAQHQGNKVTSAPSHKDCISEFKIGVSTPE